MKKYFLGLLLLLCAFSFAQTTNTAVKSQIDAAITNKTAGTVLRSETGAAIKAVVDYTDQEIAKLQAEMPANVLQWMAPVYQSGTSAPIPQHVRINTINQDSPGDANYREVQFGRIGVGYYYVQIAYSTSGYVNGSHVAVSLCDGTGKITATSSGGGGGVFYHRFEFKTYDPTTGALADGMYLGYNFIKVEIFP